MPPLQKRAGGMPWKKAQAPDRAARQRQLPTASHAGSTRDVPTADYGTSGKARRNALDSRRQTGNRRLPNGQHQRQGKRRNKERSLALRLQPATAGLPVCRAHGAGSRLNSGLPDPTAKLLGKGRPLPPASRQSQTAARACLLRLPTAASDMPATPPASAAAAAPRHAAFARPTPAGWRPGVADRRARRAAPTAAPPWPAAAQAPPDRPRSA